MGSTTSSVAEGLVPPASIKSVENLFSKSTAEFLDIEGRYMKLPMSGEAHDSRYAVIITHGLGATDPKTRSHLNDEWVQDVAVLGAAQAKFSHISYTARGHGDSDGWQSTAATDPAQFTWERLSNDMISVADVINMPEFICCGSSMGITTPPPPPP